METQETTIKECQNENCTKDILVDWNFCPECGKPDTNLVKEDRINFLVCEACGARTSVKSV